MQIEIILSEHEVGKERLAALTREAWRRETTVESLAVEELLRKADAIIAASKKSPPSKRAVTAA